MSLRTAMAPLPFCAEPELFADVLGRTMCAQSRLQGNCARVRKNPVSPHALFLAEVPHPRESGRRMILPRTSCLILAGACLLGGLMPVSADDVVGINDPIHQYWTATPKDRFSRLKAA